MSVILTFFYFPAIILTAGKKLYFVYFQTNFQSLTFSLFPEVYKSPILA